jgi:exonuclease 3'-5' domain-containing protein 1
LFAPELGGCYEVFLERPLDNTILHYCVIDVLYFDDLRKKFFGSLKCSVQERVLMISDKRTKACLESGFSGKGRHMAIAPTF